MKKLSLSLLFMVTFRRSGSFFFREEDKKNIICLLAVFMLVGCQTTQIEETGIGELYGRQITVTSLSKDPSKYCQLLEGAGLKVYCFAGMPLQMGNIIIPPNSNVLVISCKDITEESSEIVKKFLGLKQLTVFDLVEEFDDFGCGSFMEMALQIGM